MFGPYTARVERGKNFSGMTPPGYHLLENLAKFITILPLPQD
jgi:hypothetical protein